MMRCSVEFSQTWVSGSGMAGEIHRAALPSALQSGVVSHSLCSSQFGCPGYSWVWGVSMHVYVIDLCIHLLIYLLRGMTSFLVSPLPRLDECHLAKQAQKQEIRSWTRGAD